VASIITIMANIEEDYDLFEAMDSFLLIFSKTHDLGNYCMLGFYDVLTTSVGYQNAFLSGSTVVTYNLLVNFALMYDSLKAVSYFFADTVPASGTQLSAFNAGYEIGTIFYHLLYEGAGNA